MLRIRVRYKKALSSWTRKYSCQCLPSSLESIGTFGNNFGGGREFFFVKMIETSSENAFENVRISRSALRNLLIIRLFFGNTGCEMISISYRFLPKTDRNRPKPIEQIGSVFIKNRSQPKPIETDCANTRYESRSGSHCGELPLSVRLSSKNFPISYLSTEPPDSVD